MKRFIIPILLLLLLMASTVGEPPQGAANNPVLGAVTLAADGDLSTDSITPFSETTAEDVLFYPDLFHNTSLDKADGDEGATSGDYTDTFSVDATAIRGGSLLAQPDLDIWINTTTQSGEIEGFSYAIYVNGVAVGTSDVSMWDDQTPEWDKIADLTGGAYEWVNGTTYNSDYWNDSSVCFHFDDANQAMLYVDYIEITFYIMTLADSDHYAESFTDVSDWTNHNGISLTTDGDVATWTIAGDGSSKNFYTNDISLTVGAGDYFEFYIKTNHTVANQVNGWVYGYTADDKGGDPILIQPTRTYLAANTWESKKYHVNNPGTIESMMFYIRAQTGGADVEIYFDFFRMGDSTEFGWQHDCSTTAGVTDGGGGSSSSDGAELTLTADSDGSSFELAIDTTATAAYLDADYYPMVSLDFNDADSGDYIKVESYDGSAWATIIANTTIGTDTHYANCRAADADIEKFRISVNPSANPRLKSFKAFSIANFTVSPNPNVANVVYVESGELVIDTDTDAGTLTFDYDPAVSVATATYPVWNFTSSTGFDLTDDLDFSFKPTVGGSEGNYGDETRGTWTGLSGTLTNIAFWVRTAVTIRISAIKFWEDATAPDILDKFITPNEPDDDESTTLTAVTSDGVSVYDVTINAVVSADGFSDVDYDMTEQQTDLWTYEFATLPDGYYLFEIRANDGANTYSEYLPVTVRESTIVVEEITLIGAGSDFTMMQFSARINKDCSYIIYEESENNAESATHSGSVSEPSFNLAWTKLDTTDTNVNFTIKFTNGTLTYNYTSQYQVAQTALSITGDESLSQDEIVFSGTSTKACSWTLYLDSVQEDTGSIAAAGSFVVNWTRTSATDPSSIAYAIKFYTATETVWENGTYDEYSLTAFSIQTLFMDLTDPSVSAIFTTSWGNTTGYLYEDDVQQDTAAEGITLSYSKATTAGTYSVALKIDAGGEVAWYNTTYTVAVTTLQVTDDSIRTTESYAYLAGHVNLNANYIVYEETVQVGTGSVSAGSFEIRWTKASSSVENVTVLFESGSQNYPVYSGYDVAEQTTFVVEQWWVSLQIGLESYVEFYAHTSWENATIYVYDNTTLMVTVSELAGGASSNFWMSEVQGLHTITLNITHGATVHTRTKTYFIPDWAVSGLSLRWSLYTFQDNYTMLSLESNWRNCSYSVYLNGSEVATSANDPVTLNFTRAINIGTYNLTIHADGGAQTYTVKNIRYIITEEGVSYDYSSVTGGRSVRYGDIYEGDNYEGDTYENPPGIYLTAETAATIAVSTVFIFFLAVLFMNSRVKKAQLDKDKKETQ